jgi:hypothetical protein
MHICSIVWNIFLYILQFLIHSLCCHEYLSCFISLLLHLLYFLYRGFCIFSLLLFGSIRYGCLESSSTAVVAKKTQFYAYLFRFFKVEYARATIIEAVLCFISYLVDHHQTLKVLQLYFVIRSLMGVQPEC